MDWFLYDNGLRHERVNNFSRARQIEMKHVSNFFFFIFGVEGGDFPEISGQAILKYS